MEGGGNLFCILGFFLKVSVQDGSIFGGVAKIKKIFWGMPAIPYIKLGEVNNGCWAQAYV